MRAINLIPSEQRSGQPVGAGRSQGGAYAVLVLVGGLALMAFLYGKAQHQVTSGRGKVASLAAQAQQAQLQAERLAPYTSFIALREQRVQAVDSLVNSRFDWAHVLHEFARVLPSNASISALSGTIGQASSTGAASSTAAAGSGSTGATPPGSVPTFTLSGCATSQTAVASTLVRLRLIDGVKEVALQSSTAGSSGATATGGGCSGHDASFAATVIFDPLPSSSAVAGASRTVSDSTSARSAAVSSTSTGVNAR
jgi:Tfp pilus assembly protein PilN